MLALKIGVQAVRLPAGDIDAVNVRAEGEKIITNLKAELDKANERMRSATGSRVIINGKAAWSASSREAASRSRVRPQIHCPEPLSETFPFLVSHAPSFGAEGKTHVFLIRVNSCRFVVLFVTFVAFCKPPGTLWHASKRTGTPR